MERKCENCGTSIRHMRSVAKFCSSACRAEYWRYGPTENKEEDSGTKKEQLVPKSKSYGKSHIKGLKGVLDVKSNDTKNLPEPSPKINPRYTEIKLGLKKLTGLLTRNEWQLNKLNVEQNLPIPNPLI